MSYDKYIRLLVADETGKADVIESPKNGVFLEIPFRIDCTKKRDPDTAEITVYNLPPTLRARVLKESTQVELYAGMAVDPPLIFKGEIVDVTSERSEEFTDHITRIYAEDAKSALRTAVFARSYDSGTELSAIFNEFANLAGLNSDVQISGRISHPFAVLLPAREALKAACARFGVRYQIVNQTLSVRPEGDPLSTTSIPLISADTGMIGVPTSDLENRKTKKVQVRCTLNPRLVAGGLCSLSTSATGGSRKAPIISGAIYVIDRVVRTNDEGAEMTSDVEMEPYEI